MDNVLELQSGIRKYLESAWNKYLTPFWPGDQPWDNDMMTHSRTAREWKGLSADIPYWDNEFPENLIDSCDHRELSDEAKRRILYEYGKELFAL